MVQKSALPAALALLLLWLVPVAARAEATAGERLARQWCANCHVIDKSGPATTLPQGPPAFRIIAEHLDPAQIRAFLTHPHGAMPDLALTRAEIEDLIAYIGTLR
ncbi:MAG TPA: cytochrome c [Stellaceae bacterium]|nr:cytochrome c [Stellaceae bacterium]